MTALPHRLDRTLVIRARRDTVFKYFEATPRWAAWWGAGSSIDARPGGRMLIRHPNGVEVSGEVLEVRSPERIVFTYGSEREKPSPSGSSRVTIRLDSHPQGTLLQLTHEFADVEARDQHVQGWRFQFALFTNLIANTVNADATTLVDRWFTAWGEPDSAARERELAAIATTGVQFQDKFSNIDGVEELKGHLTAVQRFMPGIRLERRGDIRHCQWHVLSDWVALGADGKSRGEGTNMFLLDADGRITAVTGFWARRRRTSLETLDRHSQTRSGRIARDEVVVDAGSAATAPAVLTAIGKLTTNPIRYVIRSTYVAPGPCKSNCGAVPPR